MMRQEDIKPTIKPTAVASTCLLLTAFYCIPFHPLQVFRDTDVLYEELAANLETPVEFYVYNSDSDEVKFKYFLSS